MAAPPNNAEKKTFIAGIKSSFAANAASMAILYLTQFLLARLMKVEQYGIYAYCLSWLTILLLLGNLGLDAAALRFIPQYVSRGEWGYCRGMIARSFRVIIPVSVVLLLGGWSVILVNRNQLVEEGLSAALLISMAALPLWTAIRLTQGILQAFKMPGLSQFLDGVLSPLILLSMLGLALMLNITISAPVVMAVFVVSCAVVLIVGIVWLRRYILPQKVKTAVGQYQTWEWLRFAIPMLMIAGTYVIMNNTDVIMIGMMKDTPQAGIYSAATRLAALVSVSLVFVNMALTPYISEYFYNERRGELQHFISLSARIAALFAVPIFLVLMIYGKQVLGLFGSEFQGGYYSLLILISGQLVNVLSGSVGYIMIMTGRQKQAAYVLAAGAVLNIILNLILIPPFGIEGAAVATAVALIVWNVVLVVYIRSRINLNSTIFPVSKPP